MHVYKDKYTKKIISRRTVLYKLDKKKIRMLREPDRPRNMRIKTHYTTDGNNRSDYAVRS